MYTELGTVTLRSGEQVDAGIVTGPDMVWAPRIAPMLRHKGEPWNWQIESLLTRTLDLDVRFYILHRDGAPFANVMTVERHGVGIFAHVWTDPADRRQGASTRLIELQMDDFATRDGRALFLGTGYDSPAYHIYTRFGFRSVEPGSDYMAYYPEGDAAGFARGFFAPGPLAVEPLGWRHWPLLQPLCFDDGPAVVRNVGMNIIGRVIAEGGPMPFIQQNETGAPGVPPAAVVLINTKTGSVCGLASAVQHPQWLDKTLVDLYCREDVWLAAPTLLDALTLPPDADLVAYCDAGAPQQTFLSAHGFRRVAVLPQWCDANALGNRHVDVVVYRGAGAETVQSRMAVFGP